MNDRRRVLLWSWNRWNLITIHGRTFVSRAKRFASIGLPSTRISTGNAERVVRGAWRVLTFHFVSSVKRIKKEEGYFVRLLFDRWCKPQFGNTVTDGNRIFFSFFSASKLFLFLSILDYFTRSRIKFFLSFFLFPI